MGSVPRHPAHPAEGLRAADSNLGKLDSVPPEDSTADRAPSFLSLQKKRRTAPLTSQLAFDLTPPKPTPPAYQPIVLDTPAAQPTLYTVRQLIAAIRGTVESAYLASVNVEGEISNCRPAASGHIYFTLKDGDAQLPVVLFRRQAQLLGFKPKDGLAVEVRGRISVYESRGQLQLIAETLKPRGEGALELAFQQLKRKLRAEGLFERQRKPLPPFPHCLGIITSPHGAALRDIIQVIRRRHARLNILIYPALMQGPQCPPQVLRGLHFFNEAAQNRVPHVSILRPGSEAPQIPCVDLILIARGGGSLEDLAGFNDERLARAIAASHLPVITGIGHEIDTTIADLAADLRAPTPSAAAELVTAAQHRIEECVLSLERRTYRAGEFHLLRLRRRFERLSATHVLARLRDTIGLRGQRIDDLRRRLTQAADRRLRNRTQRLTTLETRLRRHDPALRLANAQRRLTLANDRLTRLAAILPATRTARLATAHARLQTLSPLAVLNRGYAIVYNAEGKILLNPIEALPNSTIHARLAQGTLTARITKPE